MKPLSLSDRTVYDIVIDALLLVLYITLIEMA